MRRARINMVSMRRAGGYVALVGLLTVAGCGDGKIATYRVTGKVLVNGQPAEEAMLIFCPVEGSEEFMRQRPTGRTAKDGTYQLFTFDANDGAPAGDYKIMIRWAPPDPQSAESDRYGRGRRPPDKLRGRYFNPETSGLTATVEERATELPPFELQSN